MQVNYWLLQHGFSVGIGDTVADARTLDTISVIIQRSKEEVKVRDVAVTDASDTRC